MDSSKIKAIIVATGATFIALYLGISAATAQLEAISWVGGATVLLTCMLLGKRIWLLIPFLGSLQVTLMIPGRPTTLLLAQALVVAFSLLMFLARKLPFHFRITELEFWCGLLTLCLAQVYLRNPVGINLIGGDTVGGRPYIMYAITLVVTVIMCGLRVPPKDFHLAMKLSIIGGVINFGLGIFGWFYPWLGSWLGLNVLTQGDQNAVIDETQATRVEGTRVFAQTLALTVASYINPMRACFSPRWAPLVLLSFALAASSGYRVVSGSVGLTYLVGLYYRGYLPSVLAAGLLSLIGLVFLAAGNLIIPLPANIQRSLSFLPGTWNERYTLEAESSTSWRVDIWKEVLLTDRWIQNKWLGDGLGFSAAELAMQASLGGRKGIGRVGISGFDAHREAILSNGDYHSGPVSAVRTIGYAGLLIMALAQLRLVVHAHRQIQRCRGTEWFPVALFFCIPIVWTPVFFWFVFGGFLGDGPAILIAAGMLRMLENNLPLPAYVVARRTPYLLVAPQDRVVNVA